MEKINNVNIYIWKTEVASLISDKVDLKAKIITGHKHGHFVLIQSEIHQDITNLIIFITNILITFFACAHTQTSREIESGNNIICRSQPAEMEQHLKEGGEA